MQNEGKKNPYTTANSCKKEKKKVGEGFDERDNDRTEDDISDSERRIGDVFISRTYKAKTEGERLRQRACSMR